MAVQKKRKVHSVEISVRGGNISYSNDNFKVARGDFIEWGCVDKNSHYAVHLGYASPLPKGRYRAASGKKIKDKVKFNALPGHYKYLVAVWDGKNLWTDDPIFIVKRPGG